MRTRAVVVAVLLVNAVALAVAGWLRVLWAQPGAAEAVVAADGRRVEIYGAVIGLVWSATGAVLAWQRPRNSIGWLLLCVGTCQSLSCALVDYGLVALTSEQPWPAARWAAWVGSALWLPGLLPLANVLPALYPEGSLPGPRWRWPLAAAIAGIAMATTAALLSGQNFASAAPGRSPVSSSVEGWVANAYGAATVLLLVGGTLAIWVLSARRLVAARPPERQQLAWLLSVVVLVFAVSWAPGMTARAWDVLLLLFPVAIAIGVLRHNLLGMEAVLRRGLVYGALTAAVGAGYLLATATAGATLGGSPWPGALAAAVIAVSLAPFRDWLQGRVDWFLYGERRDPMSAVVRLGDQITGTAEPSLLRAILVSVTASLRAPRAGQLGPDGAVLASSGPPGPGVDVALLVASTPVGTLRVAARSSEEEFSLKDRRLLDALAPHVAVVVRAVALAAAAEARRDQVLDATRAERQRLRRDLHDGLGPALSGVGLALEALALDPAVPAAGTPARDLIVTMRTEVASAVNDVRRIIDDLRPAALTDARFGDAVLAQAAVLSSSVPVSVDIADLPPLPADVEAAALRITQEALTNVVKHARAGSVAVRVDLDNQHLRVRVADDGVGFRPAAAPGPGGVGVESMRHRAEVLGGTLTVSSGEAGTCVTAILPVTTSPPMGTVTSPGVLS